MAEMKHWKQVYVTTDSPVDDAGNYYYMAMVPEGTKVYLPITDQAPDQALGNRGLKYNWSNNTWEVSDQDPLIQEVNTLKGQVKALLIGQTSSDGGALNMSAPTVNVGNSESNATNSVSETNSSSIASSNSESQSSAESAFSSESSSQAQLSSQSESLSQSQSQANSESMEEGN